MGNSKSRDTEPQRRTSGHDRAPNTVHNSATAVVQSTLPPETDQSMVELVQWIDKCGKNINLDILRSKVAAEVALNPTFLHLLTPAGDTLMTHILKSDPSMGLISTIYKLDRGLSAKAARDPRSGFATSMSSPFTTALEYGVSNEALAFFYDYNVCPLGEYDGGNHVLSLLLGSQVFDLNRLAQLLPYIAFHLKTINTTYQHLIDNIPDLRTIHSILHPFHSSVHGLTKAAELSEKILTVAQKVTPYAVPTALPISIDLILPIISAKSFPLGLASYLNRVCLKGNSPLTLAATGYAPPPIFPLLCQHGALLTLEWEKVQPLVDVAPDRHRPDKNIPTFNLLGEVAHRDYQSPVVAQLCSMGLCVPHSFMRSHKAEHIIRNYQQLPIFANCLHHSVIEALQDHPHPLIAQWFLPSVRFGPESRYGACTEATVTLAQSQARRMTKFYYVDQLAEIYGLPALGLSELAQMIETDNTQATQAIHSVVDHWTFHLLNLFPNLWIRQDPGFTEQLNMLIPLMAQSGLEQDDPIKTSILSHMVGSSYHHRVQLAQHRPSPKVPVSKTVLHGKGCSEVSGGQLGGDCLKDAAPLYVNLLDPSPARAHATIPSTKPTATSAKDYKQQQKQQEAQEREIRQAIHAALQATVPPVSSGRSHALESLLDKQDAFYYLMLNAPSLDKETHTSLVNEFRTRRALPTPAPAVDRPDHLHNLSILTQSVPRRVMHDSIAMSAGVARTVMMTHDQWDTQYGSTRKLSSLPYSSCAFTGYLPAYKYHKQSLLEYIYGVHPVMHYRELAAQSHKPSPDTTALSQSLLNTISCELLVVPTLAAQTEENEFLIAKAVKKQDHLLVFGHQPGTFSGEFHYRPPKWQPTNYVVVPPLAINLDRSDNMKRSGTAPHQFLSLSELDQVSIETSGVCFADPTEVLGPQNDKAQSVYLSQLFVSPEYHLIESILNASDQLVALGLGLDPSTTSVADTIAPSPDAILEPTAPLGDPIPHPYTPYFISSGEVVHRAPNSTRATLPALIHTQQANFFALTSRSSRFSLEYPELSPIVTDPSDWSPGSDANLASPYLFDSYGIVTGFDPHCPPGIVWYLLLFAPLTNEDDIQDVLQRCRSDLVNNHLQTTLMYSVIRQVSPKTLKAFFALSANPNQQDGYLRTVAHYLSMTGYWHKTTFNPFQHKSFHQHSTQVSDLLYQVFYEYGCLVNIVDIAQHSPLSQAILTETPGEIIMALIDFSISLSPTQQERHSSIFLSRAMTDPDTPYTYGYSIHDSAAAQTESDRVETPGAGSVPQLYRQLSSLVDTAYPFDPVPDWVDCHGILGFGASRTPQQTLQRDFAKAMTRLNRAMMQCLTTADATGGETNLVQPRSGVGVSPPEGPSDLDLGSVGGVGESPETIDSTSSPAVINAPFSSLCFAPTPTPVAPHKPVASRSTNITPKRAIDPVPIYIHPEIYTTGANLDSNPLPSNQQQGQEGPPQEAAAITPSGNPQSQGEQGCGSVPALPHPTKSLFGFQRGNNFTDVHFLLRPLYHNSATYDILNPILAKSDKFPNRDLMKLPNYIEIDSEVGPELGQVFSIFDLMIFETLVNHSVLDYSGVPWVLGYEMMRVVGGMPKPGSSSFFPDAQRLATEHFQPHYALRPEVWTHFFAAILLSFRLFVFFDQLSATRGDTGDSSTDAAAAPAPTKKTNKDQPLFYHESPVSGLVGQVYTNPLASSPSQRGPRQRTHPIESARQQPTPSRFFDPPPAQSAVAGVTKTLDAYLTTMVKAPGLTDLRINECIAKLNGERNLRRSASWVDAVNKCQLVLQASQRKIVHNGPKSFHPSFQSHLKATGTVQARVKQVLDDVSAASQKRTGQAANQAVQELLSIPSSYAERAIWSRLSELLLATTVGSLRLPHNITQIISVRYSNLPHWVSGVEKRTDPSSRFEPAFVVSFAHIIFNSFIGPAVELAAQWFNDYLEAFQERCVN